MFKLFGLVVMTSKEHLNQWWENFSLKSENDHLLIEASRDAAELSRLREIEAKYKRATVRTRGAGGRFAKGVPASVNNGCTDQ